MSIWNDVKKTVKEGFTVATEKTEEYTKIARVKVDILAKKKDLDRAFRDLGEKAFDHLNAGKKTPLGQGSDVKTLIEQIQTLKKAIKDKEAEIEKIKKEAEGKAKSKPAPAKPASAKPEEKPKSKSGQTKPAPAKPETKSKAAPAQKSATKPKSAPAKKPAAKKAPEKKS